MGPIHTERRGTRTLAPDRPLPPLPSMTAVSLRSGSPAMPSSNDPDRRRIDADRGTEEGARGGLQFGKNEKIRMIEEPGKKTEEGGLTDANWTVSDLSVQERVLELPALPSPSRSH